MIQLLLIAIIVGLVLAHLWPTEGFDNPSTLEGITDRSFNPTACRGPAREVHPSTIDEVDDDPRDVPWIASWSAADRAARNGQNCLPLYTEAGPDGTTILTVTNSCEAGMAHTRPGDRIIIPDSILMAFREDTIKHEMIHIYQRRYPDEWLTFYQKNWSFVSHPAPPSSIPKGMTEARRSNPDTWDPAMGGPWFCWMGRFWPVPVYRSPAQPQLRDATTIWWDDWRKEILQTPPSAWTAFFGSPAQDEHPHEIAATMIVADDSTSEAGRRLLRWWQTEGLMLRSLKN